MCVFTVRSSVSLNIPHISSISCNLIWVRQELVKQIEFFLRQNRFLPMDRNGQRIVVEYGVPNCNLLLTLDSRTAQKSFYTQDKLFYIDRLYHIIIRSGTETLLHIVKLILALSTGMNAYIADVQKDTMASYLITISSETIDVSGAMGMRDEIISERGGTNKTENQHDNGVFADYKDIETSEKISSKIN